MYLLFPSFAIHLFTPFSHLALEPGVHCIPPVMLCVIPALILQELITLISKARSTSWCRHRVWSLVIHVILHIRISGDNSLSNVQYITVSSCKSTLKALDSNKLCTKNHTHQYCNTYLMVMSHSCIPNQLEPHREQMYRTVKALLVCKNVILELKIH